MTVETSAAPGRKVRLQWRHRFARRRQNFIAIAVAVYVAFSTAARYKSAAPWSILCRSRNRIAVVQERLAHWATQFRPPAAKP